MIRPTLVLTTIGSILLVSGLGTARADAIDVCANAYEAAQRHHKAGELKASLMDAQTCSRDVCPEVLRKDCSSWVSAWRAEEREKNKPPEPQPEPAKTKPGAHPDSASRPVPTMTYVLGGAGILLLGGATAFVLNGVNIRQDLDRKQCAPSCDAGDVARARTQFLVADILGVAGLAAIAGALVIYLTRPDATRAGSVSVIPVAGGASLRATF